MKPIIKNSIIIGVAVLAIVLASLGTYFAARYWLTTTPAGNEVAANVSPPSCGDGVCQKLEKIKKTCPADCSGAVRAPEATKASEAPEATTELEATHNGFVVIHMEPGTGVEEQKNLTNPKTYWPNLVSLVETADQYNLKLTLLFNPEWAEYILVDSTKLSLLRSWEANGHEIGYHQHDPSIHGLNYWNGYTNQTKYQSSPHYLGTVDEAMKLLTQLPADGKIYTAGVSGSDSDLESDWPIGVPYRTDGIDESPISTLSQQTLNGQAVTELQHQLFIPGEAGTLTLDEVNQDIASLKDGEYLGIVFHAHNFTDENKTEYEKLFQTLSKNLKIMTVKEILK